MKNLSFLVISGIILLSLVSLVSASISTNPVIVLLDEGNPTQSLTFTNSDINDTSTYPLTLSSSLTDFVDMSFDTITFPSLRFITLSIKDNAPSGNPIGTLNYGDYSTGVIVSIEEDVDPDSCQIRPSIGEYNQDYQQGAQVPETITFDPQNCDGDIIISGVSVQGGVVDSNGKRKPVSKGMITSDEINVNIDTEGLPAKTYEGIKLTFNAYGKQHTIRFKI